jgi:transcriptional regulator with XRE-family HTH domain
MLLYMVKTPSWPADRFRDLIDHILRETGLPQAQLAALVPMDQSQLSRWKSGFSKPKYESLQSLGRALAERFPDLGVGPEELIASVYPREAAVDADLPLMQARAEGAVDYTPHPMPVLPPEIGEIKNPTPVESVLLAQLSAMQEELRTLNAKIDALAAGRDDEVPNGTSHRKGA